MKIDGCNAVITGAGGGIGRSIALALADAGANVVVVDIEADAARAVADEVAGRGVRSLAAQADVSKLTDVQALADAAYEAFGSIEILVNNAGVTLRPFRASWDTSYEDFQWVMNVNFWGVLHGHHVFVPRLRQTDGAKHIVNTSSIGTLISVPGHSAYCAAKSAVDGFTYSAREELKNFDIGVSLLHPGPVRTRIVTSERLRADEEKSANRRVVPWSDYVKEVVNPIVDKPAEFPAAAADPDFASHPMEYITPNDVGRLVIEGIVQNKPHILTHPPLTERLQARTDSIVAGAPSPQPSGAGRR